jgi:hypothetical protein
MSQLASRQDETNSGGCSRASCPIPFDSIRAITEGLEISYALLFWRSQKLKILRDLDTSDPVLGEKTSSATDGALFKNMQALILAREFRYRL